MTERLEREDGEEKTLRRHISLSVPPPPLAVHFVSLLSLTLSPLRSQCLRLCLCGDRSLCFSLALRCSRVHRRFVCCLNSLKWRGRRLRVINTMHTTITAIIATASHYVTGHMQGTKITHTAPARHNRWRSVKIFRE